VPSFVEYCGGTPQPNVIEGRSLLPLLHGAAPADWRRVAFSEYDYSMLEARLTLNQPIRDCRLYMAFDGRWKYIHATGFRPLLFDLESDPRNSSILAPIRALPKSAPGCATRSSTGRSRDHNRITTTIRASKAMPRVSSSAPASSSVIGTRRNWPPSDAGSASCSAYFVTSGQVESASG
jgi:hypothetical protein